MVWLTCPRYRESISKLEEAKLTQELQKKIDEEEGDYKKYLLDSNDNYKKWLEESGYISKEQFKKWISGNRKPEYFDEKEEKIKPKRFGNTGVAMESSIKCLHAHSAVHLAGIEDKIGEIAFKTAIEKYGEKEKDIEDLGLDCPSSCIRCKNLDE